MSNFRRGELRHRITFQRRVETINTFGELVSHWEDAFKAWAKIWPVSASARELQLSKQVQSDVTIRFVIVYRADITPSMRIVHGTAAYNILGQIPDMDSNKEYLTIPASLGISDG